MGEPIQRWFPLDRSAVYKTRCKRKRREREKKEAIWGFSTKVTKCELLMFPDRLPLWLDKYGFVLFIYTAQTKAFTESFIRA